MNSFFAITKSAFLSGFKVNKKAKNQSDSFKMVFIFGAVGLIISAFYNLSIASTIESSAESYNNYLVDVMAVSAILTLTLSIFQMQSAIFKTKDYEFLESLPVTKRTIVLSKIISVYLMNVYEDAVIMLPALIIYLLKMSGISLSLAIYGFIIGFISLFFISLIPILISSLIGSAVALMSARAKHKTIITIIGYVIFLTLIMVISFTVSYTMGSASGGASIALPDLGEKIIYLKLVSLGLVPSTFYYFLIFILINAICLALVVLFISKIYRYINTIEGRKAHEEYVAGEDNRNNLFSRNYLVKKEISSVLKKPNYLMNTASGSLMYLLFTIMFIFIMPKLKASSADDAEGFEELSVIFSMLVPVMGMFASSMMAPATASISIEGKNFETILSYPIDPKEIIKSKLKASLIITSIPTIIISLVAAIAGTVMNGFDIYYVLACFILPLMGLIYTNIMGMITGLKWAKTEFESEQQIFKNSAPIMLLMLFSGLPGFVIMMIGGTFLIAGVLSGSYIEMFGIIVPSVIYIILIIIFANVLKKNELKWFYSVLK